MLLLVLILVLIAFGLLVVALLTGGVVWAWISVGVSVAAAAVLLVDWLQRRSAVKAGTDAAAVPDDEPVPPLPLASAEPGGETATEVLPVVRTDAGGPGDGPFPDPHDERSDGRETAVLRGLTPSGSAGQPPGARVGTGGSGPFSSHSVTSGVPSGRMSAGDEPVAAGSHAGYPDAYGDPRADRYDGYSDAYPDGRSDAYPDGRSDAAAETVQVPGAALGLGPTGRDEGSHARQAPETAAGGPAHGAPPHGAPSLGEPPLGPDGAPPEEPHDAEAAAVVADLDDEVLVVDELPRYHVGGCRSLAGVAVIPLPAREAVELGFTPCAWCAPDRTLSGRRRASTR